MANEKLDENSFKKRQYLFSKWKLYNDELGSILMAPKMDEYEMEKFNQMRSKLLNLVELMDGIKEKLDKLYNLWVEFNDKEFFFDDIYNKWFKGIEEQKISYYDLHEKLFTLYKTLDKAIEEYNNKKDS